MQGNKNFKPNAAYLRELVLDYLIHNSYVDTARTFARDSASVSSLASSSEEGASHAETCGGSHVNSAEAAMSDGVEMDEIMDDGEEAGEEVGEEVAQAGTLSKETVRSARQRQEISIHLLSGRIDEATRLLRLNFPQVLQEPDVSAASSSTQTSSLFGSSKIEILNPTNTGDDAQQSRKLEFTSQMSTHPVHIALNLRIQDFIESVRTIPLPYPPPRCSSPAEDESQSIPYSNGTLSHTTSSSISTKLTPDPRAVLHKAQHLYAVAQSLHNPRDKEIYLGEVKRVGALLAYLKPEESSIGSLLSQQRRESVANQVNSAILYHLGQPAVSYLELYTRYTTAVWKVLHDMRLPCPQGQPSSDSAASAPVANRKLGVLKNERDEVEIIKPFDLAEFLISS
ncbi:hypothetical protein SCHPADRAFT_930366 [Schizopora paradoxa]|uniref:CRA domain-containing protein n=1 Tax=Schizopora paradoxa TaxID=27342 RepID=A0A0H2RGP7_9AGAM|nr:hypothetical protein SCHPADRAFT_930366 [Schizopora paradoxa]